MCSIRGLGSADLADANARLAEQVEANMGMAMIYALVSTAQDWLREKVSGRCLPILQHQSGEGALALAFCKSPQ